MSVKFPLVVISGPAGVGKTTVVKALLKIYPKLRPTVTYTTRQKRVKSTEDKIMHYVSIEEFERRRDNNEFLEWALVHGDYYGTHKVETEELLQNYPVILNIDVQGAKQVKQLFEDRVVTIFLLPESHEQIVDHIIKRGEMTEGSFQERLRSAEHELSHQDYFDYMIVNHEGKLNETIDQITAILRPRLIALIGSLDI